MSWFLDLQENLHPAGFFLKIKILLKGSASDADVSTGTVLGSEFGIQHPICKTNLSKDRGKKRGDRPLLSLKYSSRSSFVLYCPVLWLLNLLSSKEREWIINEQKGNSRNFALSVKICWREISRIIHATRTASKNNWIYLSLCWVTMYSNFQAPPRS